jgi:hypothetical protein
MNDRWFEELVQVAKDEEARERQALDDRWDRLAAGTLEAGERAELHAEAERTEEGRAAWAAFQPLGPAFQASLVAKIQAQQAGAARETGAKVLPFRGRVVVWAGAGLLAAGLVAFALLRPFLNPALPNYTIEANAGSRGGRQIVIGLDANIALQPDESSRGQVTVQCVHTATGAAPRFWPGCETHLERRPDGTLVVNLPAAATAELAPGTLRVIVGRPGRFPPPGDTAERDPAGRWQAFSVAVQAPPP